jgi:hypothetical protein
MADIQQVKTRARMSGWSLNSKAFGIGYREALQGLPMNYDAFASSTDEQWNYERGRLFAQIYKGQLKDARRRLAYEAQWAFANALRERIIF